MLKLQLSILHKFIRSRIMKVGIIGGGAAGLCSAHHVLAMGGMTPIVWEKAAKVGGTWIYTPECGRDKYGLPIHSSMYENLRTNLPKEIMGFPDFPFPEGEASFIHHTEVCKYLESYAEHFNLYPYIQFGHHVEMVTPVLKEDGPPAWNVSVKNMATETTETTTCDALIVCNGHYSVPRYPSIKDISAYKGRKVHSHDYREPSPYKDSTVVILGAAASGLDICLELSTTAKKVFLSHNHPVNIPSEFPVNVEQVRGVVAASDNGFTLSDGTFVEADVILYCTGYEYSFPFLTEECGITVEENIVKPLYKHVIHTTYPSMAFIGIPFQICPFPLFDFQVQHFIASLIHKLKLPTCEEMVSAMEDELAQLKEAGVAPRHYHKFGRSKQLAYMKEVAGEVGCRPFQPYLAKLFIVVMIRLLLDLTRFKNYSYETDKNGCDFKEYNNGVVVNTKWDLTCLIIRRGFHLLWFDFLSITKLVIMFIFKKIKFILG
ncbi:hypothetical protein SK128_011554 [Halocaridina rubra]|uniref:Flavin-containing monooxygenase n=1 Tax=Halocaridina rubra TaxID=373956 RepID=A0AAN8XCG5_HALRR